MYTTLRMLRGCTILSAPLSSKGCTLFLSRAKSTLHFTERDGPGFNVRVANSVYDEAMRKTHWHLASLAIVHGPPTPSSADTASTSRLDDSVRANSTLVTGKRTLHGKGIQTLSSGTARNTSSIDDGSSEMRAATTGKSIRATTNTRNATERSTTTVNKYLFYVPCVGYKPHGNDVRTLSAPALDMYSI